MAGKHFYPHENLKRLSPEEMGLEFTSAERMEIAGEQMIGSKKEELCLVVLKGNFTYTFESETGTVGAKDMLYLPVGKSLTLEGAGEAVLFGAPCNRETAFAKISFEEVNASDRHKVYGKAETGSLRDVWNYIDEKFDSSRFLIGICEGEMGGWTAWPPHRHGDVREEVYMYFGMGNAFALQCVYEEDKLPQVYKVEDSHLVAIREGYHPNVGCPGGRISYVYCMVSRKAEDREFMDLVTEKKFGERLE